MYVYLHCVRGSAGTVRRECLCLCNWDASWPTGALSWISQCDIAVDPLTDSFATKFNHDRPSRGEHLSGQRLVGNNESESKFGI